MRLWTDDTPRRSRTPWFLTPAGLLALFLAAFGIGLCDPLWSSMPWAVAR